MDAADYGGKKFVEKVSFEPGNDSETCVIYTCRHAAHHTPTGVIHRANHTDFCWWSTWVVLLTDNIMLSGRSGLAVACLTAVREVLGSSRAVGSNRKSHCDLQPWARAVCTFPAVPVPRSTQPSTLRGTVNEYQLSG